MHLICAARPHLSPSSSPCSSWWAPVQLLLHLQLRDLLATLAHPPPPGRGASPQGERWTATARRTSTWGLRCLSRGPRCRGPPSARGAATTACCRGSKATSATAASRTARARSASSSSSASASWRRRWRCAGSRPTRVWRASSRSRSECCPPWASPPAALEEAEAERGTRGPRPGARSWSWGGAARSRCSPQLSPARVGGRLKLRLHITSEKSWENAFSMSFFPTTENKIENINKIVPAT